MKIVLHQLLFLHNIQLMKMLLNGGSDSAKFNRAQFSHINCDTL